MKGLTKLERVMVLVVALMLWLSLPIQQAEAQTAQRCFSETNKCISGVIRQYWERNGGLAVFGFPITDLATENVEGVNLQVQWFERDRFEIQANNRVTTGRLGARLMELQGTPWQPGPGGAAGSGCMAFAETGYNVCGDFLQYWRRNGGVERFGLPLTGPYEVQIEGKAVTMQYFERRRFELHNGNQVLLGLLGVEVLQLQGGAPAPAPQPEPAPQPAPNSPPECQGLPVERCVRAGGTMHFSLQVGEPGMQTMILLDPPNRPQGGSLIYVGYPPPANAEGFVVFDLPSPESAELGKYTLILTKVPGNNRVASEEFIIY